jgi:hypothetical protein
MLDAEKLSDSREAAARWQADYDRIAARFAKGDAAAEPRTTHSGIPLKPD